MNDVEAYWTRMGAENPHWATNTRGGDDETDRYWDTHMDELYEAGESQAAQLERWWHEIRPDPTTRVKQPRVLDLGCGAGVITANVASWSEHVTAVDIAASYRTLAREHFDTNRIHNITVIDSPLFMNLPACSYDLIYSLHCLQHNPPAAQTLMIRRCMELLSDGAVAIIQTPARCAASDTGAVMQMHAYSPDKIRYLCDQTGVVLQDQIVHEESEHVTQATYLLARE